MSSRLKAICVSVLTPRYPSGIKMGAIAYLTPKRVHCRSAGKSKQTFRFPREETELDGKRVVPLGLAGRSSWGGLLAFPFLPAALSVRNRYRHWILPGLPWRHPNRAWSE